LKKQSRAPLNQSGFIIFDFIFALVLTVSIGILLFSISYSMAIVEVTQYISFSTARAHLASNKSPSAQKEHARKKFEMLATGKTAIGSLYTSGWFGIAKSDAVDIRGGTSGDGRSFSSDLGSGSDNPNRNWYVGVSIPLDLKLMSFNLPFLGRTGEDGKGFKTKLNTMLIRESSEKECQDFMNNRREVLRTLPSAQNYYEPSGYYPIEDNGC
jgi:hypothetical protein